MWIAPVQLVLMGITEEQHEHVRKIADQLKAKGYRVHADLRAERVNFKFASTVSKKFPSLVSSEPRD